MLHVSRFFLRVGVTSQKNKKILLIFISFSAISANLSWTVPTDNGGSPIIGYFIEKRDYDLKGWFDVALATSDELTYMIGKLKKGSKYSFRVSAENKYGRSEPIKN
jgi:hypothetical protein